MTEIMDFTPETKNVVFTISGDVFRGLEDMPAFAALDAAGKWEEFSKERDDQRLKVVIGELLRLLLEPDSYELFMQRLSGQGKPIGMATVAKVVPWLMSQYADVPLEQLSESSNSSESPESGETSMDISPALESIPAG